MFLVPQITSYSVSGDLGEHWVEIRFSWPHQLSYHDFRNSSVFFFNKNLALTEMLTSQDPTL